MNKMLKSISTGVALSAALTGNAFATAVLTTAASAQGYTLSTFIDGVPNSGPNGVGPIGILELPDGKIMVSSYLGQTGQVRTFNNVDGQHWTGSLTASTSYGTANAAGLARVGNNIYMAQQAAGKLVQIDSTGGFVQDITSFNGAVGLTANPVNGHLFASTATWNNIFEIDPIAKTAVLFNNYAADGLMVSPDGSTLYLALDAGTNSGHVLGFNTSSKALTFDSGFIPGGIDGMALGTGGLAGNIFVNTNGGTLVGVDMATKAQTTLVTGGSRGDFVAVDSNCSLLFTQTDSVLRLTAPSNSCFVPSTVPEPNSWALLVLGLAGFAGFAGTFKLKKSKTLAVFSL